MEQNPKLELQVNVPTQIQLLNDKCIEGSSQYGVYHLYNIVNGDGKTKHSLFAVDELHEQLKKFKKDDELQVTILAASRGNKIVVTWEVKKLNENVPAEATVNNQTNLTNPNDDFLYTAMEKSLEQSISLAKRFNSVPIDKLAISLFIARTKGTLSFSN
jgi:hypothetical protein